MIWGWLVEVSELALVAGWAVGAAVADFVSAGTGAGDCAVAGVAVGTGAGAGADAAGAAGGGGGAGVAAGAGAGAAAGGGVGAGVSCAKQTVAIMASTAITMKHPTRFRVVIERIPFFS